MLLGSNINILISIQNKSLGSIEYILAKKEGWLKENCLDLGTLFFGGGKWLMKIVGMSVWNLFIITSQCHIAKYQLLVLRSIKMCFL